jgi:hypothetical protein
MPEGSQSLSVFVLSDLVAASKCGAFLVARVLLPDHFWGYGYDDV